jgi:hypothetical protein
MQFTRGTSAGEGAGPGTTTGTATTAPATAPVTARHRRRRRSQTVGWAVAPALATSLAYPVAVSGPAQAAPALHSAPVTALSSSALSSSAASVAAVARTAALQPTALAAAGLTVRDLQQRLTWAYMKPGVIDGLWGPNTRAAVIRFQRKFGVPVTGQPDAATVAQLVSRTRHGYGVKPACRKKAHAICVDKTLWLVRVYDHGRHLYSMDARFGGSKTPTREGDFSVGRKGDDYNHDGRVTLDEAQRYVTRDKGVTMPLPLFFSRGQAVHYSPFFARDGYAGSSHGCANTREYARMLRLWRATAVRTPVYVYRSSQL